MNPQELLRRLLRHWPLLVLVPAVTVASIYFFSRSQDQKYESDTVLYTGIASGYKISGDGNGNGGGWQATTTAFDNLLSLINSRDTREEVSLRLLAWQLQREAAQPTRPAAPLTDLLARLEAKAVKPKPTPYGQLPASEKAALTGSTLAETTGRVLAAYRAGPQTPVHQLVNSKDPLFSDAALLRINAGRVKDSDLLRIDYAAKDPALCQQTLEILSQVFIRKHKELFTGQNESVTNYFARSVEQARTRLQAAEQQLAAFHRNNNIVDYEKQILTATDERQAADDKYNQLAMQAAGASSTLKSMNKTIDKRGPSTLKSQEIIRLRDRLATLTNQISELQDELAPLAGSRTPTPEQTQAQTRLTAMRQESIRLNRQIDASIASYYGDVRSQAVPVKELISDYSKNTLAVEDLQSQLALMRRRRAEAASQYNRLVPLGGEIRKIRREVEVAEKDYLTQMEGLKQSRLSQQNVVLSSQLRVVDPPYLPSQASGSKLLLLLIGGFLGSFLLTGAGVVGTGLLATALHSPAHAERVTRYPVAGVVPKMSNPGPAQQLQAKAAEDHLARQLLLKFQQPRRPGLPYTIGVLSGQRGEGKTGVCLHLATSLHELHIFTRSLFPDTHSFEIIPDNDTRFYSPLQGLAADSTVADLVGHDLGPDAVVIVEFPAVLEAAYPASLLHDLDLILLSVRADRSWQAADRAVFQKIQQITPAPIELVLNGVLPEYVTEFIGARRQSWLRPYRPGLPAAKSRQLLER